MTRWIAAALACLAIAGPSRPVLADETVVYEYDALGRLASACFIEASRRVVYVYDATGNRSAVETTSASCDAPPSPPPAPPPNDPPVAVDDSSALQHTTFDTVSINVLANDSDPDDDPLTIESAICNSGGCAVQIDGAYLNILGSTAGTKWVTYTISDGRGGTDSADVTASFSDPPGCEGSTFCF